MDPHTTTKKTRNCSDCHENPKSMGLGYGNIFLKKDGSFGFTPSSSVNATIFGQDRRLDAFVNTDGVPLVHTSRKGLRPFNQGELEKIVRVGLCLSCHPGMDDPVMKSWKKDTTPKPCKAFLDLARPIK